MAAAAAPTGTGTAAPVILFGACDRHNLGDLLFPHIAAAMLPGREVWICGLADRDLRPLGGHRVQALHRLAGDDRLRGAHLVHVGGEILTCSARQAAAMLLPTGEFAAALSYIENHPDEEPAWLQAVLGTTAPMPYVVSRQQLPALGRIVFNAVGGVALDTLPPAWRQVVLSRLAAADAVGVRDAVSWRQLQVAGIDATLMPDAAVMVEVLFGAEVRARAERPPVAEVLAACPQGYIALQLAADFGDDASLDAVASSLAAVLAETGLALVLFRAGAAPWHDDRALLVRLAARLRSAATPRAVPSAVRLFESLDVWDLCALLAHARLQVGSSLHGHLVASAFGVPAIGLPRPDEAGLPGKLAAYAATWSPPADAVVRPVDQLADALRAALSGDAGPRHARRQRWAVAYRAGFEQLAHRLR